ncbi:hypothetical protein [Paraliomyxa miuraensis]|uniref:hypothetical protein n=1 Tax=Paraliomyxa miuraensis TaxID=376150 RepID=UPI002251EA75|nr:hypothetical protein [Paraliomyxa miuraensis]MCX4242969.1 hypothetical protein [Paraliomyxa miuraensis]
MGAVELIPPEDEREWVLDALRELVASCGHEHLVCTPVVLPSSRWFPDAWSPDARGVRRLALRILRYAELAEHDVAIEMFDDGRAAAERIDLGARVHSQAHEGAAAWFAGIDDDDTCWFGANVSLLGDPGGVTAALAHETAHAFRHVHELEVEDRDLEECLTDLSTIYLGLGVLTANASQRHRSWSLQGDGGALGGHAWSTSHLGYLSPQAMCFGLAAFVRARDHGPAERRAVVAALHTNQAGFFKAAERWLERALGGPEGVRERLGLPDPQHWPAPTRLEELLAAPLEDGEGEGEGEGELSTVSRERGWNEGGKVHRVPYPASPLLGMMIVMAAIVASIPLFSAALEWLALAVLVVGLVLARELPRRFPRHECSTCNGLIRRDDERCALCGGTVAGTLARAEDRLELPES